MLYTSARVNMAASTRMVKTVKHNFTTWSAYDSVVWVEVWGEGEEREGEEREGGRIVVSSVNLPLNSTRILLEKGMTPFIGNYSKF